MDRYIDCFMDCLIDSSIDCLIDSSMNNTYEDDDLEVYYFLSLFWKEKRLRKSVVVVCVCMKMREPVRARNGKRADLYENDLNMCIMFLFY